MISTISITLSNKIKGISFLNALMVILLHASVYELAEQDNTFSWYIIKFFSFGLTRVAVPLFFFISGFLFVHQYDNGIPITKLLKRRFVSLGKPYIYWCLIYIFTLMLFTIAGNYISKRPINSNTFLLLPLTSWKNPFRLFGFDFFITPVCVPLWYIRNLFLLFLISYILLKILNYKILSEIIISLIIIYYFIHYLKHEPFPWWDFLEICFCIKGILFFMLGIYFKRFPFSIKVSCQISIILCLVWFILAWPWNLSFSYIVFMNSLSILIGCIAWWNIYDFIPWRKKLESWHGVKYSFFIFVSHYAILNILFCQKACNLLKKHIMNSDLLIYILRFLIPMVISIGLAYALERYLPKLYRALTGDR